MEIKQRKNNLPGPIACEPGHQGDVGWEWLLRYANSPSTARAYAGALRRSEAATLEWRDVKVARDGRGVLIQVRRSKTDPDGNSTDVRYLKGNCADAVLRLRTDRHDAGHPERKVFRGLTGATIALRLRAAAQAAGIEGRITGHSGRVGLAAELTARGASMQAVMLAAHYSAEAIAERGAVAQYL